MSTLRDADDLDDLARRVGRAVHAHRTAHEQSLGDLSRVSGLSKTILARIEKGEGNPSMETLWRLARALGVPLSSLLSPAAEPRVRAIPADAGERMLADSGLVGRLLHGQASAHRSELFALELPAGTDHVAAGHLADTQELVVCTKGRMRAGPVGQEIDLRAGDAVWFAADREHRYASARGATALDWILYTGMVE